MILKTASPYSGSYYQQAKRMYAALDESTHLLQAAVLQKIEPRENTDGPHEERMKTLRAKSDYIIRALKSVQKKQSDEKRIDSFIKNVMADLGHGERYETQEEQKGINKGNNLDFLGNTTQDEPVESMQDRITRTIEANFGPAPIGRFDEYSSPTMPDLDLPGTPVEETNSGNIETFIEKLAFAESSNNPEAEIKIKDSRKFVGKFQFGSARLADFKKASGEQFTMKDFKADAELQDRVAAWHVTDIDKAIDAIGEKAYGYNRDGLSAVAHLASISGMTKYVKSRGMYNPKDQLGTSLQEYYDKFSKAS